MATTTNAAAVTHTEGAALPSTAEGLLADRRVVWHQFTRVVLWSSVVVALSLVVLVWAVL